MLEQENSCLVVIDVQGKLAQLMYEKQSLFQNIEILIQSSAILDIPILWCQQCPSALGPTLPGIAELLEGLEPIDKASFSCCGVERFNTELESLKRNQTILCGIETHVCVYQTALDLLQKHYDVNVVSDAVSSRTIENKQTALLAMSAAGVKIKSMEMILFELLRTAEHPQFKQISRLVK